MQRNECPKKFHFPISSSAQPQSESRGATPWAAVARAVFHGKGCGLFHGLSWVSFLKRVQRVNRTHKIIIVSVSYSTKFRTTSNPQLPGQLSEQNCFFSPILGVARGLAIFGRWKEKKNLWIKPQFRSWNLNSYPGFISLTTRAKLGWPLECEQGMWIQTNA